LKAQVDVLTQQLKTYQEETQLSLRRIEAALATISRSIGSLSTSVHEVQVEVSKSGGSSGSIANTLEQLTAELKRLEIALKDHIGGHVGVLSQSLVGRGGFWKGIWVVVGVQLAGWVCYELYRNKKDKGKKFL
jgi:chromosome segregation ATPase